MMKRIHIAALLVLLTYVAFVAINVPPLVRSDHVSVNWNLLGISGLGLLLGVVYIAVLFILRKRKHLKGMHVAILLSESVVLIGMSSTLLFKSLAFFGIV